MTVDCNCKITRRGYLLLALSACTASAAASEGAANAGMEALLHTTYQPIAQKYDVPGLVVGLLHRGHRHFLTLGTMARGDGRAVSRDTLFEIGSISKCFTSTVAAVAQEKGYLRLSQRVGSIVRGLREAPIGRASLLQLATYTAGGLPLQFPEQVSSTNDALTYLAGFTPAALPGVIRQYSNPSIGLLGHATSLAMSGDFEALSKHELFEPLGLERTFIRVPDSQMDRYSWGHDKANRLVRVNQGAFDAEAYGIKSTASDLLTFLQAHLDSRGLPLYLRGAIEETMQPRYQVGPMQQGMGWEMYSLPSSLDVLTEGNGEQIVFQPNGVKPLPSLMADSQTSALTTTDSTPAKSKWYPTPHMGPMLLNKTGSTSGFGAYVALVPHSRAALVMLANRNFPISARVAAAHQVLTEAGALG